MWCLHHHAAGERLADVLKSLRLDREALKSRVAFLEQDSDRLYREKNLARKDVDRLTQQVGVCVLRGWAGV